MADNPAPQPGERWLVKLQPIDGESQEAPQKAVTLIDFDPRTDAWSIQEGGTDGLPVGLSAKHLIRKL